MSEKIIDISIIIVSFNTCDLLIDCIKSIIKTVKKVKYEIIVVDNASTDNTINKIQNDSSKFKMIRNSNNLGFSKANNIGIKKSSGKYLLFLNPDTLIYENTIDGMVEFMDKNKDAGASTCYVKLPDGKLDDAAHRGFPTPWNALTHFSYLFKLFPRSKLLNGYNLGHSDINMIHEIDSCAGAFMIVRRSAGEGVGWWDEDFFWYGEDLDFCFRLKEKGWKIFFVPGFEIYHYKGVSGGIKDISKYLTTADKQTRELATKSRFEAMKLFYEKHYENKYPRVLTLLIIFGIKSKYQITKLFNL